jgi:hypothetical protein
VCDFESGAGQTSFLTSKLDPPISFDGACHIVVEDRLERGSWS